MAADPTRAVAVIPLGPGGAGLARALAARGVSVVLVADEENLAEAGRLAAEVAASGGGRPAVFTPPGEVDALVELLGELFPSR